MSGLLARSKTAGLDEVREASGSIKGARFERVTGFGLSCFGISSRGFIGCWCTSHLPALAGQLVLAVAILTRGSRPPLFLWGSRTSLLCSAMPR